MTEAIVKTLKKDDQIAIRSRFDHSFEIPGRIEYMMNDQYIIKWDTGHKWCYTAYDLTDDQFIKKSV